LNRSLGLAIGVGTVTCLGFAAAAAVSVVASNLQEGTDSELRCDTSGVTVEFIDTDNDPSTVEDAKVHLIDNLCDGGVLGNQPTMYVTANPGGEACPPTTIPLSGATSISCTFGPTSPSVATTTSVTVQIIGKGLTPPP
jgi:hypothetical protein